MSIRRSWSIQLAKQSLCLCCVFDHIRLKVKNGYKYYKEAYVISTLNGSCQNESI